MWKAEVPAREPRLYCACLRRSAVGVVFALLPAVVLAQPSDPTELESPSLLAFPAVLLPGATALIKSKQDERVAEVSVEFGSRLEVGQLMMRFVDAEERIRVERAEFVLRQSRAEHERMKRLHQEGQVSDELLENAETNALIAGADLELARIRLEELSIRAPYDGLVAERYVDPGATVQRGDPLLRVIMLSRLRLEAMLPEEVLPELRAQRVLEVTLSWPPMTFEVAIPTKPIVIDPASRTFLLRIEIPNADERIVPGTSCTVSIPAGVLLR